MVSGAAGGCRKFSLNLTSLAPDIGEATLDDALHEREAFMHGGLSPASREGQRRVSWKQRRRFADPGGIKSYLLSSTHFGLLSSNTKKSQNLFCHPL